ncbi:hypothetical protein [Arthrobacter sp. AD-310]
MLSKLSPFVTALLLGGLAVTGGAPANAEVVERYSLDSSRSGVNDDFCGSGLRVAFTYDQTGSGSAKTRGDDGLVWVHERLRIVQTFTYNGMTVTDIQPNTLAKDLKITDNGDGTLSITVLLTGENRLIGSDGKILAKGDGQVRRLLTVDQASGDVISDELIFGSTGTNDDFCEAILAHWGI